MTELLRLCEETKAKRDKHIYLGNEEQAARCNYWYKILCKILGVAYIYNPNIINRSSSGHLLNKMKVEIKGDSLVITMPFNKKGKQSKAGKSMVHATTKGNIRTELKVNEKTLIVGVNAYTLIEDNKAEE